MCTLCMMTTQWVKAGPCGGPRRYAAKISCARCHRYKKRCAFTGPDDAPRIPRKRNTRDRDDNAEGSSCLSRTARTDGTAADEESGEDERRRKRIRYRTQVPTRSENDDPSARLKKAYKQLADAEVELAMARIAMNEYVSQKNYKS